MTETAQVFIIDADDHLRHELTRSMQVAGYRVRDYRCGDAALNDIHRGLYGVVVAADSGLPLLDGLPLLSKVFAIDSAMPIILTTTHGKVATAVEAMRKGAYDFIEKPFASERLSNTVARALEKRRLVLDNRRLRQELQQELRPELAPQNTLEQRLVGRTGVMVKLRTDIAALAKIDIDVLVWGETGSGKEVVARALHEESSRQGKPFVALNCGAIPIEMMESELFGHESGAFTSAHKQRVGKLEYANGGTLFLDEIESMPIELQIKLLRVIETRTIERLGSNKSIPLNLRFITATKTDLEHASRHHAFRADLYYRLNVVTLTIPPLRERRDDIPLLVQHLAREASTRYQRDIPEITAPLIAEFTVHTWPGNVRELRNVVDRWVLGFGAELFPQSHALSPATVGDDLPTQMANIESSLILAALTANGGSIKKTYEQLKISRKALYEKMKKYQLKVDKVTY